MRDHPSSSPGGTTLAFDKGTLLLTGLGRAELRALFPEGKPWVWDHRVSAWRCDALHYGALARMRGPWRDEVPQAARVSWGKVTLPILRREQREAVEAWTTAGGRGQIIMPTGTGKTEVALAAMAQVAVSTLVVAPVRDLMYQWQRRILRGLGYDPGILGDACYSIRPITVTTYDSAYIHMALLGARFGLIVFDEAHHLPGRCRREAALMATAPQRMGLTATPERPDGLHADLDHLIGPVVYRQEVSQARGRTLAQYDIVRIPVALREDEQQRYSQASQLVRAYIAERRKDKASYGWQNLCADSGKDPEARRAQKAFYIRKSIEDHASEKLRVLEDIFRLHPGERVIVFAGSNAMAMEVSRRFLVPTLLNHSRKTERLEVLEGFAQGRFPVIVANQVLDEGVDVPEAKVAVVIGGQSSARQAKQRLGRIVRKTGEARAVLYEVVCEDTREVERSRRRRKSDAYERTRHRRL